MEDKRIEVPPGLDSAREHIEMAKRLIEQALDAADCARQQASDAARAYLMDSPSDELIDRATYLYWNVPEIKPSVIASVVLGDPKATHKLLKFLKPGGNTSPCVDCGTACAILSRSRLNELKRDGKFRPGMICHQCEEIRQQQTRENWADRENQQAERLQALRTMPYREYLTTEEWLETRNQKLRQAHFKCQLCYAGGLLDVHHRTYERRGCEYMADLTVLCRNCHSKFHGKLP